MEIDNLELTYISDTRSIPRSERAVPGDLFLISHLDGSEYASQSLDYGILCASIVSGFNDIVKQTVSSETSGVSSQLCIIELNYDNLEELVNKNVSATIKIANCIQKSKQDIQTLYTTLSGIDGGNGIEVEKKSDSSKWIIKHSNTVDPLLENLSLMLLKHDSSGHIVESQVVDKEYIKDLLDLEFLSATGDGLVNSYGKVSLREADEDQLGGIKLGFVEEANKYPLKTASGKAYVEVPPSPQRQYNAGVGLSVDQAASQFSLKKATKTQIGGVRIFGNNLDISKDGILSARDTTYSAATSATYGLIKVSGSFNSGKSCPVKLNPNGYAYVDVYMPEIVYDLPSASDADPNATYFKID